VGGEDVSATTLQRGIDLLRTMLRPRLTKEALGAMVATSGTAGRRIK